MGLTTTKAVQIFEYGKNDDKYRDRAKLHKQVVRKTLLIVDTLYPGYSLCFLFNNAISHSVYTKDPLQVKDINKRVDEKQSILRNEQFDQKGIQITYLMTFLYIKNEVIQKEVQKFLKERRIQEKQEDVIYKCEKTKFINMFLKNIM